ncbi:hypothetical protein SAMN02745181_0365 [Rubritalea squalenifaciens DSM 18772]|uniref:Uncharacterized protein n=1 Tax=Rubritalea squalenifaciens DSM 18772 TaxID=1123071 RepID=A0A1M6C1X5_9BACT|nr:hypothetical protein [Rubritalea squalenifaciens]SHI54943.1 hypothetical protein SAMN02745181_0365 [Rubritalea squalenifaciens DSM 18772]
MYKYLFLILMSLPCMGNMLRIPVSDENGKAMNELVFFIEKSTDKKKGYQLAIYSPVKNFLQVNYTIMQNDKPVSQKTRLKNSIFREEMVFHSVNLLEEISTHVDLDNKKGDELRRLFEEQKTKKFHIIVHGSITK